MSKFGRRRYLMVIAVMPVVVLGCSSDESDDDLSAVTDEKLGEDLGELVAAVAPDGAQPICIELAEATAIVGLPDALSRLGSGNGADGLEAAADDMDRLSTSGKLEELLGTSSKALRDLATSQSDADWEHTASALDELGTEVQELCGFPMG